MIRAVDGRSHAFVCFDQTGFLLWVRHVVRQPALGFFLWTGDFGLQEFAKWDTGYLLCDFNNWKQINVEKLKEAWCSSTCVHWAAAEDQLQTKSNRRFYPAVIFPNTLQTDLNRRASVTGLWLFSQNKLKLVFLNLILAKRVKSKKKDKITLKSDEIFFIQLTSLCWYQCLVF